MNIGICKNNIKTIIVGFKSRLKIENGPKKLSSTIVVLSVVGSWSIFCGHFFSSSESAKHHKENNLYFRLKLNGNVYFFQRTVSFFVTVHSIETPHEKQ